MFSSLATGLKAPIANLTSILSFLLGMSAYKMHSSCVVRRKYFRTPRACVPESFLVHFDPMGHSGSSGFQDFIAFAAREVSDLVRLDVRSEASFRHERLTTNIANVVLVVRVHMFVHTIEIYEMAKANLAGKIVLIIQFERTNAVTEIAIKSLAVIGY